MMQQGYKTLIFLLVIFSFSKGDTTAPATTAHTTTQHEDSPIGCSENNVACIAHTDNLVEYIGGISDVEECRQLCNDEKDCQYLTYYDATSFPYREACFLLKNCDEREVCQDCLSEPRTCYQSCIFAYTGAIDDNVLDLVTDVASDLDCRNSCLALRDCTFYTFFTDRGQCYLLSELLEPIEPCVNCLTGPDTCKDEDRCLILYNGTLKQSLMLTETTTTISTTLLADDHCAARFFLVGGGGEYHDNYGGGAGSGYLKYSVIPLTETTTAQIKVGDQGQASTVTINGANLEAGPGEDNTYDGTIRRGGNGFSGGGGGGNNCKCNGGSDGGDGAGDGDTHLGGRGTGEKLSSFTMDSFLLTPGVGGQYYSTCGGGGGGVLVNGAGPAEWDTTQGQGYGGGGCGYDSQGNVVHIGLRGVILLEMVP